MSAKIVRNYLFIILKLKIYISFLAKSAWINYSLQACVGSIQLDIVYIK